MKPREMLKGKLILPEDLATFRDQMKKRGKKTVFTAGSWDLIHVGQMRYLAEAKRKGDVLVVGVLCNDVIRKLKGVNKPVLDEWIRAESLAFLRDVDYITLLPIASCVPTIEILKPNVFVSVVEDYTKDYKASKEYKTVTGYDGEFVFIERQSLFLSTSQIAVRVIGGQLAEVFEQYVDKKMSPIKEKFE